MVSWLSGCRYDGGLCEVTRVSQSSGGNGCGRAGFHSRQAGSFYSLPPPSSVPSSLLTTLRLDFSMGDWADALADAAAMATEAAAIPSSRRTREKQQQQRRRTRPPVLLATLQTPPLRQRTRLLSLLSPLPLPLLA